jgi:hypothetical protein
MADAASVQRAIEKVKAQRLDTTSLKQLAEKVDQQQTATLKNQAAQTAQFQEMSDHIHELRTTMGDNSRAVRNDLKQYQTANQQGQILQTEFVVTTRSRLDGFDIHLQTHSTQMEQGIGKLLRGQDS